VLIPRKLRGCRVEFSKSRKHRKVGPPRHTYPSIKSDGVYYRIHMLSITVLVKRITKRPAKSSPALESFERAALWVRNNLAQGVSPGYKMGDDA
jgi:hypothetical protein